MELCMGLDLGSWWEGWQGWCQCPVSLCPGQEQDALAEGCGRTGRAGLQQKVRARVWVWHPVRGLGSVVGQFLRAPVELSGRTGIAESCARVKLAKCVKDCCWLLPAHASVGDGLQNALDLVPCCEASPALAPLQH